METAWKFLKNLEIEPPNDPAIPLVGVDPKNPENHVLKRYWSSHIHSSRKAEGTQVSSSEGRERNAQPIPIRDYHPALKRKAVPPRMTAWVAPEDIVLNEMSQTQEDKGYGILLREVAKGDKSLKQKAEWWWPG